MKIKPKKDLVLVREEEGQQQTQSGLFLPTGQSIEVRQGEVLDVGPGIMELRRNQGWEAHLDEQFSDNRQLEVLRAGGDYVRRPPEYSIGDHVVFLKTAGLLVHDERGALLLVREHDILGLAVEEGERE